MTATVEARQATAPPVGFRHRKRLSQRRPASQKPLYQAVYGTLPTARRARAAAWDCIKDGSFIDPCCGGGAMLIAFAKNAQQTGINYQTDVLFVGNDIDPVVARMCYISMSLLGMPGYVIIGNSLLMECREVMYTPMYFMHGFQWRRQRNSEPEEETTESINSSFYTSVNEADQIDLVI